MRSLVPFKIWVLHHLFYSEMAGKGNVGIEIDVVSVPQEKRI